MNPLLFPGDFIAGRYQILNEIGRGGHGTVFRALDSELHVEVAVKVLNGEVADQDQYVLRLWREAQSLAALWGASVVQVHEFDTDERGFVYLVMELLAGEPFDAYLFDLETFGDRMNPAAVLDALGPVANALSVAHRGSGSSRIRSAPSAMRTIARWPLPKRSKRTRSRPSFAA
jgi:serine/threonine protein kinase